MLKNIKSLLVIVVLSIAWFSCTPLIADDLSDYQIEYAFAQKMQLDTIRVLSADSGNRVVIEDLHFQDLVPTMQSFSKDYYNDFNSTLTELQINDLERNRLRYVYERNQQSTLFSSLVPNALSIASIAYFSGLNMRTLIAVAGTALSSYSSYLTAKDQMELEYLQSNWDLDDDQKRLLDDLENKLYSYVCDIVVSLGLPRSEALSKDDLISFVKSCHKENPNTRYTELKRMESRLVRLPDYWRELAKTSYDLFDYEEALQYLERYESMYVPIFFHDNDYAEAMMIKASCLIETRDFDDSLISELLDIAKKIQENISMDDWLRYFFCANLYQKIYEATSDLSYAEMAFDCMYSVLSYMINEYAQATDDYLNLTFIDEGLEIIDAKLESADTTLANEKATKENAIAFWKFWDSNNNYYDERINRAQAEVDRLNEAKAAFRDSIFTTLPPLDDDVIVAFQIYDDYAQLLGKKDSREYMSILSMLDEAIFYAESREVLFDESSGISEFYMASYGDSFGIDFILRELPKLDSEDLPEGYPVSAEIDINGEVLTCEGVAQVENYGSIDSVYLAGYIFLPDRIEVGFSKDTYVQPIKVNYYCDLFDMLNPTGYFGVTDDVQKEIESRLRHPDNLSTKVSNVASEIPIVNWFF